MLSISIIITTLLGLGTAPYAARAADANETVASQAAGSMDFPLTQHALDPLEPSSVQTNGVARVPGSLVDFVEDTVDQLSRHAPFTTWDEAKLDFTPLGPGTHGWLVTLSERGLPQGYLIISAGVNGEYVLSEYGIGSTLPFSQAPLNERLAAEGLMKAGATLPQGSIVRKLYDVSPIWQVELPGKKPVYFSGLNSELLPDERPQPRSATKPPSLPSTPKGAVVSTAAGLWISGTPSTSSVTADPDPYDNLLWLASTPLQARSSTDLQHLLEERSTLIFKSAANNAAFGAPFHLTGWQSWSSENEEKPSAIYVSVPIRDSDTLRFLPASRLLDEGMFYASLD